MSVSVCVTFVVSTGCESCTRPISTNPGSMEAGECALTRGTCFATRRLELVVVAGRLWISWRVCGGAGFFRFFFSSNAHGLLQVRGHTPCLMYLSTSTHSYPTPIQAKTHTHEAKISRFLSPQMTHNNPTPIQAQKTKYTQGQKKKTTNVFSAPKF